MSYSNGLLNFKLTSSKGEKGDPGVGYNLTVDGNYDIENKRLVNVASPISDYDTATKKYADGNSSGVSGTSSTLTIDSNIDMKDTYRILNLKTPIDGQEPATKQYAHINFILEMAIIL